MEAKEWSDLFCAFAVLMLSINGLLQSKINNDLRKRIEALENKEN